MRIFHLTINYLKNNFLCWTLFLLAFPETLPAQTGNSFKDKPYLQNYSFRYNYSQENGKLLKVFSDRNGYIQLLSEKGLLMDLVNRSITNSHRNDIDSIPANFRNQFISEVLPPDELPIARHNSNRFRLDEQTEGRAEHSAGDFWLLPYWMGRFLGIISEPLK